MDRVSLKLKEFLRGCWVVLPARHGDQPQGAAEARLVVSRDEHVEDIDLGVAGRNSDGSSPVIDRSG